jgi:predicted RNA-binding protein YlxR (DUF448 family)
MADPIRTCVACRRKGAKPQFLRIARAASGQVNLEPQGRGAYVCPALACIEKAFERNLLSPRLKAAQPDTDWNALKQNLLRKLTTLNA